MVLKHVKNAALVSFLAYAATYPAISFSADVMTSKAPPSGPTRIQGANGASGAGMVLAMPFNSSCAAGFSKAGDKANNFAEGMWTDWYVCGTPVIQCPAQMQGNGRYSGITPKAVVQLVGGNPDGGSASFRVQYKCDYSYTPIPVG